MKPIYNQQMRVLILGSYPSEQSLAKAEYYGNPRNQFWRLIFSMISGPDPHDYAERKQKLLATNIGLWDVYQYAARVGSLDSKIDKANSQLNQFDEIFATCPELQLIALNGGTAFQVFQKNIIVPESITVIKLPSSSPAYTMPFEQKLIAWEQLMPFLNK